MLGTRLVSAIAASLIAASLAITAVAPAARAQSMDDSATGQMTASGATMPEVEDRDGVGYKEHDTPKTYGDYESEAPPMRIVRKNHFSSNDPESSDGAADEWSQVWER